MNVYQYMPHIISYYNTFFFDFNYLNSAVIKSINLSFDWLPLTVDDRVRGNDAALTGVSLHHLELHRPHAPPHKEDVTWQRGENVTKRAVLL